MFPFSPSTPGVPGDPDRPSLPGRPGNPLSPPNPGSPFLPGKPLSPLDPPLPEKVTDIHIVDKIYLYIIDIEHTFAQPLYIYIIFLCCTAAIVQFC